VGITAGLGDILSLCPESDSEQLKHLRGRYGLTGLDILQGAVVFGAAKLGSEIALHLRERGIEIQAFSDNDPARWNTSHFGWPVLPPHELPPHTLIIIGSKFVKEITGTLLKQGILRLLPHYLLHIIFPEEFPLGFHSLSAEAVRSGEESIAEALSLMSDQSSRDLFLQLLKFRITLDPLDLPDPVSGQYFPGPFWVLSPEEVFVDVGAFTGDTMLEFLERTKGAFSKYFALEPAPRNLDALIKAIPARFRDRIIALPYGAGEQRRQVPFLAEAGGESRIAEGGPQSIEIVPLDELLAAEEVSTIKIDVEGYEREVLAGARRIISQRSPKLAVSVYHLLRDLWELPVWISHCNPGYRYYLRHHTEEIYDTVLYCVPGQAAGEAAQ